MKHIFTISILFWSVCLSQAQVVPNGGFEEWDNTDTLLSYPYPLMWKWTNFVSSPMCPSPGDSTMEPSAFSSSGCCSVKLTTQWCRYGFIFSSVFPPNAPGSAFECMARPAYLNFQYMFHPEGGDSAYVKILLFNADSTIPGNDTIGFASGYMHEEVTSFTSFTLPINYFSEDTPAYMHIWFSNSKTVSEMYPGYFGAPGNYAHVGTTLWLDDVHLSGTTNIQEYAQNDILTVFPNPAGDRIWFKGLDTNSAVHARVFDAKGARVMDQWITDPAQGLDVKGLRPGVYSIMMLADDGGILMAKWVKE